LNIRLPKNSLFAVLLRSPWWISAAVGAVLALLAMALLPEKYRVVGALGATPFFVIAAMAARRQWHLPSASKVEALTQQVNALAWPAFAQRLQQSFERDGWTVQRGERDPVDFKLQRPGRQLLVHARRWKSARIGLEPLRALQAAREDAGARDALCICLGELSDTARPFANRNRIAVWHATELAQALHGRPPVLPETT